MDEASGSAGVPGVGHPITRRQFLGGATVIAAYATIHPYLPFFGLPSASAATTVATVKATPPFDTDYSLLIQVERDTDLAVLDFVFYNFTVSASEEATSIIPTTDSSVLLVRFPPQSIGEALYLSSDVGSSSNETGLAFDPPPILSALSGPSQIAFLFNASAGDQIPLPTGTESDLLDWSSWILSVPPVAHVQDPTPSPGSFPTPQAPGSYDTFIEFPYALYLSPVVRDGSNIVAGVTTFENFHITPLTSSLGVTDVFTTSMVQRPYVQPTDPGPGYTVNEIDQPLDFAALWCDDLSNDDTDVTSWTYIQYGVIT